MADGDAPKSDGRFGTRVQELNDRVAALEERAEAVEEIARKVLELVDPGELDAIWENFREMTEILSNVRRHVGLSPLNEFVGSKMRRRLQETRAQEARAAAG